MKSEPDRLDLLVVLLPVALLVVLGVQAYHFFESREGRAAGAELALQVEELAATRLQLGGSPPPATPATEAATDGAAEPAAAGGEADPATDGAAPPPAAGDAPAPNPDATTEGESAAPAPAGADPTATATTPNQVVPRPGSEPPQPPAPGGTGEPSASRAAATPPGRAPRPESTAGGTLVGGANSSVATPPSPPGDEPPAGRPSTTGRGSASGSPDADTAAKPDSRQPARVTAAPLAAEGVVGQLIPVEIRIANGANVGSVPFHLKFDPKVLKLNAAPRSERGAFLAQDGNEPQFLVATGPAGDEVIIGLSLLGASAGASGDGTLCTIYFLAIAPGNSPLQFTHASVRGTDARMLPATFLPSAIKVNG